MTDEVMNVEEMAAHLEPEHGDGQRQADPEAARHVAQLGTFAGFCCREYRLQGHAADGAVAGAHLAHLRVHRAGVLDVLAARGHARHRPFAVRACVPVMPME